MKAILLFLVLLNTLFFAWARWVAQAPGANAVPTPEPDAERIVLWREKVPQLAESAGDVDELAAAADPGEPDQSAGAADSGTDSGAEPVIAVTDEPVVTASADAAPAQPAPAAPVSAEAAAPSEPVAASPMAEPVAQPVAEPPAVAAAVARRCVSVGPFNRLDQASVAREAVLSAGGSVTERREPGRIWVGHWVHLEPVASREAAVQVVEKLREDGVSDIYIETSQPLRNAISLGLFLDASRAEIRAGKIRKLGVRPQIRDRFRDGERIWLEASLPEDAPFDVTRYQVGPIELELNERDCAAAAQASLVPAPRVL